MIWSQICIKSPALNVGLMPPAAFVKNSVSLDEAKELYTFDTTQCFDVFNAIMSLPKKERLAIHLFYYEDMQIDEIAQVLRCKPSAVKTRLHRARTHLKSILGDDWINE